MNDRPSRDYRCSEELLERSLRVIPLGAQTFSKSYLQYPKGAAPLFAARAQGSRMWDVDGNEYVDFNNALCSVTLGHCDPEVTEAVQAQLRDGTIFSLSHPLETEVAEMIVGIVPCADMVRFGKNGSDATSGAIRAARAFTGRERVAVCGYHGWQDWYIGSTARNKGVPLASRALTHPFPYNDADALDRLLAQHPGEFAAVILEPMNIEWPRDGFLEQVAEATRRQGALLIFDETITGFRFAPGGAQQLFGIRPDLACFGKGLANGYPLAAVAGRGDVMREFEEIFFSFTMGGETLSLAAAKAALTKLSAANVTAVLADRGQELIAKVEALVAELDCGSFLSMAGHPSWSFLKIADTPRATQLEIKTLYMQEILAQGVLSLGTHNMSYAHSSQDVDRLVEVYRDVFPLLKRAAEEGDVGGYLRCKPLEPLFRVR